MPRGDANGEIGIEQMPDNAAAEKSGAAKYGHASVDAAKRIAMLARQILVRRTNPA